MTSSIDNEKPEKPDALKANRIKRQIASFGRKTYFFQFLVRVWKSRGQTPHPISFIRQYYNVFRIAEVPEELSLIIGTRCYLCWPELWRRRAPFACLCCPIIYMDDSDRLSCPKKASERAADPSEGRKEGANERKSLTSHFHTNALFLPSFLLPNARGEWATCRF